MNLIVSGIVGGVNDQNITVNTSLCRWLAAESAIKVTNALNSITFRINSNASVSTD